MNCGFTPEGLWFVFSDDGKTQKLGLKSKRATFMWMHDRTVGKA